MEQKATIRDGRHLSLNDWLREALKPDDERDEEIINYRFPTDEQAAEYLRTIEKRSVEDVKRLLRKFLFESGSYGHDRVLLDFWREQPAKLVKAIELTEFAKRTLRSGKPWEGNTWILDLLPGDPQKAIDVIDAYFTAHIQFLPDGKWDGLLDAQSIIRAKFCDTAHPRESLLQLRPRHFEFLVASLYEEMGFTVKLTKQTRDGGYDMEALSADPRNSHTMLVECKLYDGTVGRPEIVRLNGIVEARRATKGILVTSGRFSKDARTFAANIGARLELIDYRKLNQLFNRFLGSDWPVHMNIYISRQERALAKAAIK